jgi:thiol:disulfide interchange protein
MIARFCNARLKAAASLVLALSIGLSAGAIAQEQFHVNKDLYSETADPAADIAAAQIAARQGHKRILLEFGGNWCGDCQVLDYYYHQAPNADLLAKHYVVVRIDIGHMDRNMDIAKKYQVPVAKGVPALAVLDAHGKLLYSEQPKEFERSSPEAITAFLNHWKG